MIYSLAPLSEDQFNRLIDHLRLKDSNVNILTSVPNVGYHSQTLGVDQNRNIFIHDTGADPRIVYDQNLDHDKILECILYTKFSAV